jgi:hypothetical protein
MNRYPDPFTLQANARNLRHEAFASIARAAAIKWRSLVGPSPCPAPAPSRLPGSPVTPNA